MRPRDQVVIFRVMRLLRCVHEVSANEVAAALGVSNTSVWSSVEVLRSLGWADVQYMRVHFRRPAHRVRLTLKGLAVADGLEPRAFRPYEQPAGPSKTRAEASAPSASPAPSLKMTRMKPAKSSTRDSAGTTRRSPALVVARP